jgi:hypothetical protein
MTGGARQKKRATATATSWESAPCSAVDERVGSQSCVMPDGELLDAASRSLRQVAGAIHKSPAYVSQRLRVFEHQDLREPVLDQQLSISSAEELLRVPTPLRLELMDQAVRERWTPAQARAARLLARARCLDSKHLTTDARPRLEERLHALRAELSTVNPEVLTPSARREAVQLLDVLRALVGTSATA